MIGSADEFARLRLSDDPIEYERAARESAAVEVWLEVVKRYPEMREWVAHNKTVPIEILEVLATDPDPRVRWSVAAKRKLTPDLFSKLAHDEDESVRIRVAWNAKTPERILRRLAEDPSERVRESARNRLS